MEKSTNVRATLIELWKRVVKISDKDTSKIYINGENNLYPNEIERVINNSTTAKSSAKLMAKFISGNGNENNFVVNSQKRITINDCLSATARSLAYHNGAFIHVGYGISGDGKLERQSLEVLDYTMCRISKEDDLENAGKIYYNDYEVKKSFGTKKTKEKWFYPYNPNLDVVLAQIKADSKNFESLEKAIGNYRGQVFYLNLTPEYIYSISNVDSVFNLADTEYRIGLYINKNVRSGFLGKTAILTKGLDVETSEKVQKDLAAWLGAENSDSLYHLDLDTSANLDEVLKVIQMKANFDEKLFSETIKNIKKSILSAFNNIPEALVSSSDSALFGTNSETYSLMKSFYNEQTNEERKKLEETFSYLGFPIQIIKL